MRRYLTVTIIVLALHLAAALLLRIYRTFLVAIGGVLIHATDIADIPDQLFAGAALVGALLVVVTVLVMYGTRPAGRRLTNA